MAARELLELTPCDLYSFIRGRTLWLVGDSIQQVQLYTLWCHSIP